MRSQVGSKIRESSLRPALASIRELAADYSGVYLVGGAVRDLLLDVASPDIDIVVEGDAVSFAEQLAAKLSFRVHIHERFQTATLTGALDGSELEIDLATARSESYSKPAALPDVRPAGLKDDLFRRDFTVNAIAASLNEADFGKLYDPFNGYDDLSIGTLRVIHEQSFRDDPTRIFRGIAYAARFGFTLEEQTAYLARAAIEEGLVSELSSDRLREALFVVLTVDNLSLAFNYLEELGLAAAVSPALNSSAAAFELIAGADQIVAELQLAQRIDRHSLLLASMLVGCGRDELESLIAAIEPMSSVKKTVTEAALRAPKLASELSQNSLRPSDIYQLLSSCCLETAVIAAATAGAQSAVLENLRSWVESLSEVKLEIDGGDLLAAGAAESPAIGEALHKTLMLKLDGELSGRESELTTALNFVDQLYDLGR